MKIGDRLAVTIDGVEVTEAFVEDIEDGQATIVIPATRLVAQVRQTLDLAATPDRDGPDRVLSGLETPLGDEQVIVPAPSAEPISQQHTPLSQQTLESEPKSLRDMDFDSSAVDKE